MVSWPAVPLLKPFRALRYDEGAAGAIDDLVAPPYDVITPEARARLLARSPWNAVRLVRPDDPAEAARELADWQSRGVLVREEKPAVWLLEEEFTGPDGVRRTRRGIAARARLRPYGDGVVLPHENTFAAPKEARLQLLRATRVKPSPIFLLHHGRSPAPVGPVPPTLQATLDGVTSRLWRMDEPRAIERILAGVEGPLLIADGHHRYESALRFHEEDGSEATAHVLAVLVGIEDEGLEIFPTHRMTAGAVPDLDGRFRQTPSAGPAEAAAALAAVERDHPAFVLLRPEGAALVEGGDHEPRHGARGLAATLRGRVHGQRGRGRAGRGKREGNRRLPGAPADRPAGGGVRPRRRAYASEEHVLLPEADERAVPVSPSTSDREGLARGLPHRGGAVSRVLDELPTRLEREPGVGTGEGGDETTAIDAAAEAAVVERARVGRRWASRSSRRSSGGEPSATAAAGSPSSATRSTEASTRSAEFPSSRSRSRLPGARRWTTSSSASCTTSGAARSGLRAEARARF